MHESNTQALANNPSHDESWFVEGIQTAEVDLRIELTQYIVVDDSEVSLVLIKNLMNNMRLLNQTECFNNAQDAIVRVQCLLAASDARLPIKIMIMDYAMPKKTGLEIATEIKRMYRDQFAYK